MIVNENVTLPLCIISWWRHKFLKISPLLLLCEVNGAISNSFPRQTAVSQSFQVLCHVRLNKRFSKCSTCRSCETPCRLVWRHCNVVLYIFQRVVALPHCPWVREVIIFLVFLTFVGYVYVSIGTLHISFDEALLPPSQATGLGRTSGPLRNNR